jgi:hypothetical protein
MSLKTSPRTSVKPVTDYLDEEIEECEVNEEDTGTFVRETVNDHLSSTRQLSSID